MSNCLQTCESCQHKGQACVIVSFATCVLKSPKKKTVIAEKNSREKKDENKEYKFI